jgi:hypothetical protein
MTGRPSFFLVKLERGIPLDRPFHLSFYDSESPIPIVKVARYFLILFKAVLVLSSEEL